MPPPSKAFMEANPPTGLFLSLDPPCKQYLLYLHEVMWKQDRPSKEVSSSFALSFIQYSNIKINPRRRRRIPRTRRPPLPPSPKFLLAHLISFAPPPQQKKQHNLYTKSRQIFLKAYLESHPLNWQRADLWLSNNYKDVGKGEI